jgi:glycosyltransferase involved in cell wall biosynthesis
MNPSLSVILPVCNAEETLGRVVSGLLDTLPDLTGSFEVLIVDDASTDHTPEIADDWRRTYPQVRVVRHGWSWGTAAAVRTGRLACRGQHVIVISSLDDFHPRDILRQWELLAVRGGTAPQITPVEGATSQPQLLHRAESAHGQTRRQRSPSFLRHLRQLSGVP